MWKGSILFFACLAVLACSCSSEPEEVQQPGELRRGEEPVAKEPNRITVQLKPGGEFLLDGRKVSMEQLKDTLRRRVDEGPAETVKGLPVSMLEVSIVAQGDVRHGAVSDVLYACALARIRRTSFTHPQVNDGQELRHWLPVVRIDQPPGRPVIALQEVRVKLLWVEPNSFRETKDPDKGRTLLKVKNIKFPYVATKSGKIMPDYAKLRQYIANAKEKFKPTRSYKSLPVIIDARKLVPFRHVMLALVECLEAGATDIAFAAPGLEPEYDESLKRTIFKRPRIEEENIVEKPITLLEEEVEITEDSPRETSLDNLSNKNLDSTSVVDAYGIGGGGTGAYGQRFGKGALAREGGSPGTESAVIAALRWLRLHQDKDGKWDHDRFESCCKKDKCGGKGTGQYDVGVTGLALLAYMGSGNTHRVGKFKKTVRRGLDWLRKQQQADGCLSDKGKVESWVYNHAIGTLALCEVYAVSRDYKFKNAAQRAVDYILKAQNPGMGWHYKPKSGRSDTSVTGWMVLALKAAKNAGLRVETSRFDWAISWFDRATNTQGKCGYMHPGDPGAVIKDINTHYAMQSTMTGVSVYCRLLCGQARAKPKIQKGVEILMAQMPEWDKPKFTKVDPYYWFWATNAVFQFGGEKWRKWNRAMKVALLDNQRQGGCADGSWDPVGKWDMVGGRVCTTALCALTLETYYRYKRAKSGAGRK